MEHQLKRKTQAVKKSVPIQRTPVQAQSPQSSPANTLLQLQSTVGNRKVGQLIQAKKISTMQRRPRIQRFESDEHAEIGDDATRGSHGEVRTVQLAPDYRLTYGEMTAMGGDFFGGIEEMRRLANAKSQKGVGTREELEYVRVCKVRATSKADEKEKAKAFSSEVIAAVDKRYYGLALNNRSHFLNPAVGDEGLSTGEKAAGMDAKRRKEWATLYPLLQKNIPNAAAGYHQYHVQALFEAYHAGLDGKSVDQAMAAEAFGSHYLSDAFSGGHLRTQRASINEHWNKRVPMFNHNLKGFIAQELAKKLSTKVAGGMLSTDAVYDWGALEVVSQKVDAKGYITFGDVVSGAVHDFDNTNGVQASIQGEGVKLYGDGHLKDGNEKDRAMMALNAGMQDILKAWEAGQKKADPLALSSQLLDGGLFLAESLIPTVTPDSQLSDPEQRRPKWDYDKVDDLLKDDKFIRSLKIFANEKANEFQEVAEDLGDPVKQKAFEEGVIKPLRAHPDEIIKQVINWVPNTGGGWFGHNQDDKALEYLAEAKKKNALPTLTVEQKVKVIQAVFPGVTTDDDCDALMEMINAKPSDVAAIVAVIGWDELEDELGDAFSEKYPKEAFAAAAK
jgi:hypothetical protein